MQAHAVTNALLCLATVAFHLSQLAGRSLRKWYASLLRTGSGRTGPALEVGTAGSLAPAREIFAPSNKWAVTVVDISSRSKIVFAGKFVENTAVLSTSGTVGIERFSIECRKTKTKVVTTANQSKGNFQK